MRILLILFCLFLWSGCAVSAQTTDGDSATTPDSYRVYAGDGTPSSLEAVMAAMGDVDVVFVGETHNDPTAHMLQAELLKAAFMRYGAGNAAGQPRPVTLSMEMFERDVQYVVEEYLADLITEKQFLASSRPWQNYETDYRPLVEFARAHRLAVVAANAPRRYVNRVTRLGPASLDELSDQALATLPPLPFASASSAYQAKWDKLMAEAMAEMMAASKEKAEADSSETADEHGKMADGEHGKMADGEHGEMADGEHGKMDEAEAASAGASMHGGPSYLIDAQSLWDASMAHSLAKALMAQPGALVLHMVGGFHVEGATGTPEHLLRYRPGTRILVVAVRPHTDVTAFDAEEFGGLGDFVILTDEELPRTFDAGS